MYHCIRTSCKGGDCHHRMCQGVQYSSQSPHSVDQSHVGQGHVGQHAGTEYNIHNHIIGGSEYIYICRE